MKGLAIAASVVLLIGAVAVSILVFSVVLTAMAVGAVYLWWKTRSIRRQMRAQRRDLNIIEGEVVRDRTEEMTRR
ncbi:MAG: hypothetical protein DIU74_006465 [Pseudomonadota bacterium]|nr:MAG: hypothetical protein DIU71_09585 [Pseudomonadota bacterium]